MQMQRTGRRAASWLMTAITTMLLLGACRPPAKPPQTKAPVPDAAPAPTVGKVNFACQPAEATVVLDGTPRGTAGEIATAGGLDVPFGLHRIELRLDGYQTFRLELDVTAKPELISVELTRRSAL